MAEKVDITALLEAGAHFGHKTSRWHPKMAPYIHSKRGGIHIIDLTKTVEQLEKALNFAEKQAATGHQILFVGTKRQAKESNNNQRTHQKAQRPRRQNGKWRACQQV